jgi:TolB-like protein/DNA-binding SARP family transcriptional activator/Tfp pilus assembly protein PilF
MIQVQTFGAVDLRRDGAEVRSVLTQPKRMALFVHLLLGSSSGYQNRDAILARFWPDADDERARNSLRQALHYLRRSLGEGVIVSRGDEIGVSADLVRCDAVEFQQAISAGRLEQAMELYAGDFLPAFYVEDAPAVEAWIDEERGHHRRQAFRVATGLAEHEAAAGQEKAAVIWARRAVAIEPFEEAAVRRLMEFLARSGEAAAALTTYEEFAARLKAEHELEPGGETRGLASLIRERRPSASGDVAADGSLRASRVAARESTAQAAVTSSPRTAPHAARDGSSADVTAASREPASPLAGPASAVPPSSRAGNVPGRFVTPAAAAIVLLLLGVAGWQVRSLRAGPETAPAVAVLPFMNLSDDATHAYLADGLAEELLDVLTRVPALKVAARSSAFSFRGKGVPPDSVARALGVSHVVEGSVRASGERLRIAVQLVEARTGLNVWSASYDRATGDLLAVQDEIARDIAKSLQLRLSPAIALPSERETRDAEAYRLLLRANQVMRSGSTNAVQAEAAALLEEALRRDPEYPRALAALANVLSWQANNRAIDADSGYARARRLAERSLALSPTVEAHLVLARTAEFQQWDTAAADAHYRSALELNPLDPRALQFRALFLSRADRPDEAVAAARRAVELDPLHPGSYNNLAAVLMDAERFDEASAAYLDALRVSPEDPIILLNLANLMTRQQRWDEALGFLDRSVAVMGDDMSTRLMRASILLRSERRDEGLRLLAELEKRDDIPRHRLANLYSLVGDVDRILDLLEDAVDRREDGVAAIRSPTMFNGIREHPRFVRLLERIGD